MTARQNIVWIASYPKSGNTWTRIFLSNCLAPKGKKVSINALHEFTTSDIRPVWYNQANGAPFVGQTPEDTFRLRGKVQQLISASGPGHRLVKTHTQLDRIGGIDLISPAVTAAAIYIMRNPFDVALSFARHIGASTDEAIDRIARQDNMMASATGIVELLGRWDEHVERWLAAPGLTRHVMRYEDMLADPERAFRALVQFMRLPVNDGQLRRAVRASSFKALQEQEHRDGFRERPDVSEKFFHSGKAGSWREALSPSQVARIRGAFLPALQAHYPELLEETAAVAASAA